MLKQTRQEKIALLQMRLGGILVSTLTFRCVELIIQHFALSARGAVHIDQCISGLGAGCQQWRYP